MSHASELSPDASGRPAAPTDPSSAFLTAGGEMGARMRRHAWAGTPLGPVQAWPPSLRTAVSIILSSRYAMFVWWGSELVNLYNDAYRPFLGQKHPAALGQPARQVWAEIWDQIGPRTDAVLRRGEATYDECLLLPMDRHGYLEETYFTFSYSPIRDDDGAVGGVFCAVTEETSQVIGERRLKLLREVGASAAQTHSATQVCVAAAAAIAGEQRDLPFALLYLTEDAGNTARLAARAGIGADDPAAPATIDLRTAAPAWPLTQATALNDPLRVDTARLGLSRLPTGAWDRPPYAAAIMPLADRGTAGIAGFLVAGLNPYLMFDDSYRGFIGLLGGQIAAGVANARAYEEERKRAEALAEIDRAKTAFFSNVSHEFRTPLTLMLGPLEDVLNDPAPLPEAQRANLETAHRNSLRLLRLVNTLLDFSRIEAGRLQASYAPADLAVLTTDLASGFRSAIERAGLTLDIHCAPLPEPVHVDHGMWEKIVLNLLSNAFKFTFVGGITVSLKPDGANAMLAVRDTGVGIPAHELPRLFERFHRIEGQRSRSFEGSGIGLSLVHELVRLHGGAISAQSEEGRGATFTVTIPFGAAHLPAGHLPAGRIADPPAPVATEKRVAAYVEEALRWLPDGDGELAARPAMPRATVLVADDNADMRQYVSHLLDGYYAIVEAADGEAALEAARRLKPDLVLSDVMMPRLDGYGLLRAIRADPALRELPVILLSARAGDEARAGGLDAGADDYIVKPFSARELVARVNAHLTLAGLRREAAQALRETNDRLEARVAERTAELRDALQRLEAEMLERTRMQEALRQAQKMEAIGQLTGGIAHDFNNLLTVIMGSVERIQQALPADNRRLHRDAEMAMHGSRRAAALTHKLLAYSRRQPLDPQPTDINRLVSETSALLHRSLGETIELEGILAPHLWMVDVDRNQFENALLNLAVNARDAMPEGGTLTIETRNITLREADIEAPELPPGDYVVVAVGDTGHGVPPDVVDRVFDPFFTTKEPGRGTGLGLSQVYGFIKQSGGHVRLESEPDRGTTVRLYLPRHAGQSPDGYTGPADPAAARGNGEVVLVVEDDDQVRANTVEMLNDLGYVVLEAADAATALRIGQGEKPIELLFTDVVLPGKCSGRQLAEMLASSRPEMKVLYTTGYSRDAIVHNGRLDAGVSLITKPFLMHELAAKVRSLLDE